MSQNTTELFSIDKDILSMMHGRMLLACLLAISYGDARETSFSVHDDVLAYPQVPVAIRQTVHATYTF